MSGVRGANMSLSSHQRCVETLVRCKAQPNLDLTASKLHVICMQIYKIFQASEWAALREHGTTAGAPIDVQDGYVHFSTAEQVTQTAVKHFAGQEGLFLLGLSSDALGENLIWEPSRGGALFPHLYGALKLEDVEWAQPLPLVGGTHQFPAGLGI